MKKRIFGIIAMALVTVMALSSCGVVNNVRDFFTNIFNPPIDIAADELNAQKIIDFQNGADPDVLFASNGWTNGDVFNVVWTENNVKYENGLMKLSITEEQAKAYLNDVEVTYDYTAGEARTQNYYGYGDYEVSMKPSANPGTASTFFVCTGNYDVKYQLDAEGNLVYDADGKLIGTQNPHDEIDIEFLGNDTTHVQFNFFVDGKGGNEYMYDLGFDASEEFHEYGFRWTETSITWFVDNVPVYMVTTDASVETASNVVVVEKLPSTAGRILTNYWCGNEDAWGWMGQYQGNAKDSGTEYQWIATSAAGAPLNPEEKPDTAEIDWSEIQAIAPAFPSTPEYTVAVDGNTANVTYTEVGGASYKNIEMSIADAAAVKNYVHLTITNNGDALVKVRINVNNAANSAINLSATQDGDGVFTDLEWGGSFFEIAAGKSAECVVKFNGVASMLQLMIDSATYGDAGKYAGDITISDLKFAKYGEIVLPDDGGDEGDNEGGNEGGEEGDTSAYVDFDLWIGDGAPYVTTKVDPKTWTVTYENMVGAYQCAGAWLQPVMMNNNKAFVTFTNNGTATVKIMVQAQSGTTYANIGEEFVDIAAGESATVELAYTGSAADPATQLLFFIDSPYNDDPTARTGSVTISNIYFVTVGGNEGGDEGGNEGGDEGDDEGGEEGGDSAPAPVFDGVWAEFKSDNPEYNIDTLGAESAPYVNSVKVTYTDLNPTWQNVSVWLEDKWAEYTVFELKITNNGAAEVNVFVKLEDAAAAELKAENKTIAAGETATYYFEFAGGAKMIYFFIDSTNMAAAGPNSGDITISDVKFGKVVAAE